MDYILVGKSGLNVHRWGGGERLGMVFISYLHFCVYTCCVCLSHLLHSVWCSSNIIQPSMSVCFMQNQLVYLLVIIPLAPSLSGCLWQGSFQELGAEWPLGGWGQKCSWAHLCGCGGGRAHGAFEPAWSGQCGSGCGGGGGVREGGRETGVLYIPVYLLFQALAILNHTIHDMPFTTTRPTSKWEGPLLYAEH